MSIARSRSLLAALAAAAVFGYGLAGHALPQMETHDGMAGAAAGLCMLLATVLTGAVACQPRAPLFPAAITSSTLPLVQAERARPDGRARASPPVLQRFLS